MANTKRTPIAVRFWSKVRKTAQCWLWTAQLNNKGYGCFSFYPVTLRRPSRNMYAHRVAWTLTNGPIPRGMNVLHRCDTPACVRPDHLFLGTQLDNCHDTYLKGRVCHGSRHPCAKLTESDVRTIREDRRAQRIIAAEYGVSQIVISEVKRRVTWKHVI